MIKVAAALNSFASAPEATAPPSEDIFVLSAGQLEAIITQAIECTTAPLAARLDALERGVRCGEGGEGLQDGPKGQDPTLQVVQDLQAENLALKHELEAFQEITARERAYDRQRLVKLENPSKAPGDTELSRAEKIAKYLKDRPDRRATFETLKGYLGVDNVRLNEALKVLMTFNPGRFGIARLPGDKRKKAIIMLPK
jgi:hypothetical protein